MFFDRANPDSLPRRTKDTRVCGLPQRRPHEVRQRQEVQQGIRGSGAQWTCVAPPTFPRFFDSVDCEEIAGEAAAPSGKIIALAAGQPGKLKQATLASSCEVARAPIVPDAGDVS
jgi:hypothetical protein